MRDRVGKVKKALHCVRNLKHVSSIISEYSLILIIFRKEKRNVISFSAFLKYSHPIFFLVLSGMSQLPYSLDLLFLSPLTLPPLLHFYLPDSFQLFLFLNAWFNEIGWGKGIDNASVKGLGENLADSGILWSFSEEDSQLTRYDIRTTVIALSPLSLFSFSLHSFFFFIEMRPSISFLLLPLLHLLFFYIFHLYFWLSKLLLYFFCLLLFSYYFPVLPAIFLILFPLFHSIISFGFLTFSSSTLDFEDTVGNFLSFPFVGFVLNAVHVKSPDIHEAYAIYKNSLSECICALVCSYL